MKISTLSVLSRNTPLSANRRPSMLRRAQTRAAAIALILAVVLGMGTVESCSTLNALAGLSRVQFKLNDVGQLRLAGVDITNKRSVTDFGIMDAANLLNAFRTGTFPLTFTLNVAAKNPNQPSQNNALSSLQLTQFPWRLLVDGNETISGGIGSPVSIPSGGNTQVIPLQVSLDLKQFFGNRGYDDLLNLALAIAGQGAAKLQLKAQPTVSTPIGTMRYPNELTIVSTEFRS
jgi:hypothetical protein